MDVDRFTVCTDWGQKSDTNHILGKGSYPRIAIAMTILRSPINNPAYTSAGT
jgi:hypothetical protein